jgi:hypothetical protein
MFSVYYHDNLDHVTLLEQFNNLVDAKQRFNEFLSNDPEEYDLGYELVDESDPMEWEVLDYQEVN